jgi:hypothetical protein
MASRSRGDALLHDSEDLTCPSHPFAALSGVHCGSRDVGGILAELVTHSPLNAAFIAGRALLAGLRHRIDIAVFAALSGVYCGFIFREFHTTVDDIHSPLKAAFITGFKIHGECAWAMRESFAA